MAGLDTTATQPGLEMRLEAYRRELTGYCYRMLGSAFEAEDAVQETMLRAWRGHEGFEGRAALKSWVYRIATNVCLDMIDGRRRRARPMDLSEVGSPHGPLPTLPQDTWIEPIPDGRALDAGDPAELAVARETLRLAFVGALQHLPARQRAILILREVLRWRASEVADLLETSVASVNSALQRARASLADSDLGATGPAAAIDPEQARARRPLRRGLRELRHRVAGGPPPRGGDDVDAAVQPLAARARRCRPLDARDRLRLPRIEAGPGGPGQRVAGVRPVSG